MISKNADLGIRYIVAVVKHGTLKGCPVTRFAIRDTIHGKHGETFTYWVSVFEKLSLRVGDEVVFVDFDNLTVSYDPRRKKVNHFLTAVVRVIESDPSRDTSKKEEA